MSKYTIYTNTMYKYTYTHAEGMFSVSATVFKLSGLFMFLSLLNEMPVECVDKEEH